MAIRFNESDVRSMGRTAAGVHAISLRDGDSLVSADAIAAEACERSLPLRGRPKRHGQADHASRDFPIQKRAGLGVIAMNVTARTGDIVCAGVVETTDDLIFISAKGIVMRTKVECAPHHRAGDPGRHRYAHGRRRPRRLLRPRPQPARTKTASSPAVSNRPRRSQRRRRNGARPSSARTRACGRRRRLIERD